MGHWKRIMLAISGIAVASLLSACGTVDESVLNTTANYAIDITMPFATPTPLPEYLNVPDAIIIDSDGNVTLNDVSVIEGDFVSAREEEQQTEYRSLALGATGIAVQALQSRLEELGYYEGEVSGVYDIPTETAVRRFEQTYGTMQTGVATQKLQLRLFNATAPAYMSDAYNEAVVAQYTILRPGAVGSSVYALQQRLKNLGYPISDLSGAYDQQTGICVRLFYQMEELTPSDIADVDMQRMLYSEDAPRYDPSVELAPTQPPEVTVEATAAPGDDMNVSQIQYRLVALGYLSPDRVTGVFDDETVTAVNAFLESIGREPTGTLTEEMRAFLMSQSAPALDDIGTAIQINYETLSPGDSGEAVMNLQRRLVELGYASGNPNGKYGNATISAVQLYQALNGLEADGIASAWLQSMLYADDARTYDEIQNLQKPTATIAPEPTIAVDEVYFNLTVGSNGNAVTKLQSRLSELGYDVTPSGSYDEATRQAVAAFQTAICVPATGEASSTLQRYITSKAAPGPDVRFYNDTQNYLELMLGDQGEEVIRLQQQLFDLNLLNREDVQNEIGLFNDATRDAVVLAQRLMGYDNPDGVAGIEFQSFVYSRYSRRIKQDD